jgi:hypothetical protein
MGIWSCLPLEIVKDEISLEAIIKAYNERNQISTNSNIIQPNIGVVF